MNNRISLFTFNLDGGAGKMLRNLAWGFHDNGFCVDLVFSKCDLSLLRPLPESIRVINFNVKGVLRTFPKLFQYLKTENPQILLSTVDTSNIIAILASLLTYRKRTIIIREANNLSATWEIQRRRFEALILKYFIRHTYRKADSIIAVSNGVADDLKTILGNENKVHVIKNPVITPDIHNKASDLVNHAWIDKKLCPVILSAGRLVKKKNIESLIRAFRDVRNKISSRLIILGEGPEKEYLKELSVTLGLSNDIVFLGKTCNPYKYMAKSDLFVLSSNAEGHPNVLVEALYNGLPVISTNCPSGPEEILNKGEFGSLVPPNDPSALADSIVAFFFEEKIDSSYINNIKKWGNSFNYKKVAKLYLNIIFSNK